MTIEDLVETIIGDIADEHDEPDVPIMVEQPDGGPIDPLRGSIAKASAFGNHSFQ